jgi:excisionase family DNA binding protein
MGMLDMATYTQLQAADAMRDAANNEGGGAGLTAGIGAGMGIGNIMGQALQGGYQQPGQPQQSIATGAAAASATPDVMTPAEAAAILRVSEEDVIAAIQAGDLKARKLGSAYRISKSALDEFLGS